MANGMEDTTTPDESTEPRGRRPEVKALVGFLVVLLLILILFRGVLFPFLMAMFIAYLIEPLVARLTRSKLFGIRWTRGPTIVLLYVLILGGLVALSSCAVADVSRQTKYLTLEVADALKSSAERARFRIVEEGTDEAAVLDRDVRIPAGTRVRLHPVGSGAQPATTPAVFTTHYDVVIPAGESYATVLLDDVEEGAGDPAPTGELPDAILDAEGIRYDEDGPVPDAAERFEVAAAEPAAGLEVWLERKVITPALGSIRSTGFDVEPTQLRVILATQARTLSEGLPERVTRWGRSFVGNVAFSIYEFILILMLTAFIVMDRRRIAEFFASLPPASLKDEYHLLLRYVDQGLAGVIRGQLVVCLVNGVLTYVGLMMIGVKGALLLAVMAGILSLIPIFGTILSTVPIVVLALTDGVDKALFALGWIMLIHLVEANFLNPLIMGSHARLHPVVIIFALLAGEHAFGVWGALLAVPTASILWSCFRFYRHEIEGIPTPPPPEPNSWIERLLGRRRAPESEVGGDA